VVVGGDTIRVPGFAALFHRHPKLTQRGGLGAVASGILLFVVAGVTTPLAVANTGAPHALEPRSSATTAAAPSLYREALPPKVAPAGDKVLTTAPVHSKRLAPVDHGVISGLAANGIPSVALNAYRVAAARMGNVDPGCGIDWALLAGIGREESDHGRFGGAVLHSDGVSTPKIIGPALDGKKWDFIPAPANGRQLDGDAVYAHALGPMQFIPSTWAIYGTDATGDGKADIFNINDAALGAARYLCAAGGDLRQHAGQVRAVMAYNHNDQYLAQVLALADAYRRGVPITGIPVGITSGPLPKVTDTGYIPPANPGAPTAVDKSGRTSRKTGSTTGSTRTSAPARSSTSAPRAGPGSTSSAPKPSSSSAAPKPSGSTSSSTAPAAPPSPTCNTVQSLLGCKG
jgi:membrane-bound lytic murein transglycosylase B